MTRADSSPEPEPLEPDPAQPRPNDALVEPLFAGLSGAGGSESTSARRRKDGPSAGDDPAAVAGSSPEWGGGDAESSEPEDLAAWDVVDPGELARESTVARLLGMLLGALLVGLLLRLVAGLPLVP